MPDWTKSMIQTFEFYVVDPETWRDIRRIDTVLSCTITYDRGDETLGHATLDCVDPFEECYVRVYLITIQNNLKEKFSMGTFLVQSPSISYDGKITTSTMDGYSPLMELKEKLMPIGYTALKNSNILEKVQELSKNHMRTPIVTTSSDKTLEDDFTADISETVLEYANALLANVKYEFALDELCRITFAPVQETDTLQPIWTFDDSNSSIILPELTVDRDLYGIPNVVEVYYQNPNKNNEYWYYKVVNDDPNSPVSTVSRGREIVYRTTDVALNGEPTREQVERYANELLKELSSIEYTITYTHGYCPVRLDDCVRLNYERSGITNVKARVISQTITCEPGCPVEEKVTYTKKLWG